MPEADAIDRLLDAIDHVKADEREAARAILRELIQADGDFEDAWLWMSVAVDSIDQSTVCLDNVLRVNPDNLPAAGALYRLRETEMQMEKRRHHYRFYRDLALVMLWGMIAVLILAVTLTYV